MIFTAPTRSSFTGFESAGRRANSADDLRVTVAATALNHWVLGDDAGSRESIWKEEDGFPAFRLFEFRNRLDRLFEAPGIPESVTCWGWEFFFLPGLWCHSIRLGGIVIGHRGWETEAEGFAEDWNYPLSVAEAVLANRLESLVSKCRGLPVWIVSESHWRNAAAGELTPETLGGNDAVLLREGAFVIEEANRGPVALSLLANPGGGEQPRLPDWVREGEIRVLERRDGEDDGHASQRRSRWLSFGGGKREGTRERRR